MPQSFGQFKKLLKLYLDDNQLTVIPAFIKNLVSLMDLSMAVNKIKEIEDDALESLGNLAMLDLHQNNLQAYSSVPSSPKLDQILLAYNQLTHIENLERASNITVLDLHNNKLDKLPESVCSLYNMKTLTISNNNLSDIDPKISLIDSLVRIAIEGNPLRSIKPAMRNAGANELKEFLKMRLGDEDIAKEDKKQAMVLKRPGATI